MFVGLKVPGFKINVVYKALVILLYQNTFNPDFGRVELTKGSTNVKCLLSCVYY